MGFEQSGFNTKLAYDRRSDAVSSWNRNRTLHVARVQDITQLTLEMLDEHNQCEFKPAGVIGGPPCQGFSLANRNGNVNDPRNVLVTVFFDLALKLHDRNPLDFIVMENVPAIAGRRGGNIISDISNRLDDSGFSVNQVILDAADYGVPQRRKRLFLLAINKSFSLNKEWKPPRKLGSIVTVRKAIGGLPEPEYFNRNNDHRNNPHHENHWCMKPKSEKFFDGTLAEGYNQKRSFKTLSWDHPSYTVSYGNREVHVHPSGTRRLSVYEALRLQGFPNKFVLNGSMSSQITQVSEAVPPPLAHAIANSVVDAIYS